MGHPFVPQRYLRNFENPSRLGFIWLHDKRGGPARLARIEKVAQAKGFYGAETEASLARDVETPGNAVIRKLASHGPQYFVTTDNPAFFFRAYGLAGEESTHALHGSWRIAGSDLVFLKATQAIVKEINRRLASDTERVASYHEAAPWLLTILPKKEPYLSVIRWPSEPNNRFQRTALTHRR